MKIRMKRRLLLTALILGFVMFFATDMKAQNDGFFSQQSGDSRTGSYLIIGSGAGIEAFADETPLSGGLFALTATGLVYLIGKRRKENE